MNEPETLLDLLIEEPIKAIKRKTTEEDIQKIKDAQSVNAPLIKSGMFKKKKANGKHE